MPNGEKSVPLEALPTQTLSTQERITQVLGERSVGVQEDETLSKTVSRLREEEGENYSLGQSSIIFRVLEQKPALGEVETLHVLGPQDPFTGTRSYRRFYRDQEIPTIIQELNPSQEALEQLSGKPNRVSLPIAERSESREGMSDTLTINYQEVSVTPGSERTQTELATEATKISELLKSEKPLERFDFQEPSAVAILETGRLIYLGLPNERGQRKGWWVPLQSLEKEAPHQFRADEVRVAYLSDELPAPGAGDLPRRRQIEKSSIFDKKYLKDEKRKIVVLDLKDAKGDIPRSDAWRLSSFHPGIEKVVKVSSSEIR